MAPKGYSGAQEKLIHESRKSRVRLPLTKFRTIKNLPTIVIRKVLVLGMKMIDKKFREWRGAEGLGSSSVWQSTLGTPQTDDNSQRQKNMQSGELQKLMKKEEL